MDEQQALPKDSPILKAWDAFIATEEFLNIKKWVQHPIHSQGSLWAVFLAGYCAACKTGINPSVNKKPTIEELEAILARPEDDFEIKINPDGSIRAEEVQK